MCTHLQLLYPKEIGTYREAVDAMRRIGRDCIEKRIKAVTSGEEVPNDILTQILQTSSGCGYLHVITDQYIKQCSC